MFDLEITGFPNKAPSLSWSKCARQQLLEAFVWKTDEISIKEYKEQIHIVSYYAWRCPKWPESGCMYTNMLSSGCMYINVCVCMLCFNYY